MKILILLTLGICSTSYAVQMKWERCAATFRVIYKTHTEQNRNEALEAIQFFKNTYLTEAHKKGFTFGEDKQTEARRQIDTLSKFLVITPGENRPPSFGMVIRGQKAIEDYVLEVKKALEEVRVHPKRTSSKGILVASGFSIVATGYFTYVGLHHGLSNPLILVPGYLVTLFLAGPNNFLGFMLRADRAKYQTNSFTQPVLDGEKLWNYQATQTEMRPIDEYSDSSQIANKAAFIVDPTFDTAGPFIQRMLRKRLYLATEFEVIYRDPNTNEPVYVVLFV